LALSASTNARGNGDGSGAAAGGPAGAAGRALAQFLRAMQAKPLGLLCVASGVAVYVAAALASGAKALPPVADAARVLVRVATPGLLPTALAVGLVALGVHFWMSGGAKSRGSGAVA
jgi:hypothetical protein